MSPEETVQFVSSWRRDGINQNKIDYGNAVIETNKRWVSIVQPLVQSKVLTIDEVVELAGINRQRVYELFRLFPSGQDQDQEVSST